MADHAYLCAQVAHDGGDRVGDDNGSAVGEFEHVADHRPIAGLPTTVHGASAQVVIASAHGHGRGHDVFATFLGSISVEHVLATGNDASVPEVLSGSRNFEFKGHAVNGIDIVICIAFGNDPHEISSLHNIGTEDLRRLDER